MLRTAKPKSMDSAMSHILGLLSAPGVEEGPVEEGLVVISHFNANHAFDVIEDWREENWLWKINWGANDGSLTAYWSPFGVCDDIEQFKRTDLYDRIVASERSWCVFFTHIQKNPEERDGWRWHKWGPYIGEGEPQCEYLADEPFFDNGVYTYHVYELA